MRPRHSSLQQSVTRQEQLRSDKKDITYERADIAGFTLLFQDKDKELKWRSTYLAKHMSLTARFLFLSAMYQGLFFIADVNDNNSSIFLKGCWRLACGLSCLMLCFLVATSLIVPSQILLFYVQLSYGGLSLALHFLGREHLGLWDFLIVVYGLCFFMLPKISPLNFLHSFMGSSLLSLGYIYISAFWLHFQQWLLSTVFLMVIVALFMYISYSSEKSSRERWLLRERLHQEHIDLQIVASSIQDDMAAATQHRLRTGDSNGFSIGNMSKYMSHRGQDARSIDRRKALDSEYLSSPSKTEKMNNFFKGIAAWAICMSMGYAFQVMGSDPPGIRSNSKAFALLLHSMGFSIFLLYFTGQMRWFLINGMVGIVLLWIFNETGLDNRWAVISTHSIGYFILALVVISSILVFGGVVLVWSHLVEFLMNILTRYPEVQDEIRQEKVLEQVLIRYLANMPKTTVLHPSPLDEESEFGVRKPSTTTCDGYGVEEDSTFLEKNEWPDNCRSDSIDVERSTRRYGDQDGLPSRRLAQVLESRKSNSCFFCTKADPKYLLPACSGWTPRDKSSKVDGTVTGIPMCTPYTELAHARDLLSFKLNLESKALNASNNACSALKKQLIAVNDQLQSLTADKEKQNVCLKTQIEQLEQRVVEERTRREEDLKQLISQHNSQLAEVKRLYKSIQARQQSVILDYQNRGHMLPTPDILSPSNNACTELVDQKVTEETPIEESNQSPIGNEKGIEAVSSNDARTARLNRLGEPEAASTSSVLDVNIINLQRDFDRMWMESFEEIQTILRRDSDLSGDSAGYSAEEKHPRAHLSGGSQRDNKQRMKYAVNLTD